MGHLILNEEENNQISLIQYYYFYFYFYFYFTVLILQYKFLSVEKNSINIVNLLKLGGPLFIKIGQNIANKKNIDPILKNELIKLQDQNFNDKIVKPEYLKKRYNLENIDKNPIASGSIAAIYKIKYQNKDCVIKVLHKDIRKDTILSINLFDSVKSKFYMIDLLNSFKQLVDLNQIYKELLDQTDLNNEVKNLNEIKNNFQNKIFSDLVIFPQVLYHNNQIIIETYEEGLDIKNFVKKHPDRKEEAAHLINCVFYKMFFDNCIHADMHFSNVRFKIIDNKVRIVLYDFGLVTRIDDINNYKIFINVYKKNMFVPDKVKFIEMIKKFNKNPKADLEKFETESLKAIKELDIENSMNMWVEGKEYHHDKSTTDCIKIGLDIAVKNNLIINDYAFNICNGFILLDDYNTYILNNDSILSERYNYANKNGFIEDMKNNANNLFNKKKIDNNTNNDIIEYKCEYNPLQDNVFA